MLLLALLVCACGAEADEVIVVEAEPAAAQPEERPEVPLCEGSPPASPALCQSLRYGDQGYCNRWVDCAGLP